MADESFDLIHARALAGNILNWEKFYQEAYRCLKPGAWFKIQETSFYWRTQKGVIAEDRPMGRWNKVFQEGGKKTGRTLRIVDEDLQERLMKKVGSWMS